MEPKPSIRHDADMRRAAVDLFEKGAGYWTAATALSLPPTTVRKWHRTYISIGEEALFSMGSTHRTYSWELKCEAAKSVVEGTMSKAEAMARFGVVSLTSLERWAKAYREGGPEALRPKPKGRPKGSASEPKAMTREQELERRVQKLEAENAYLKKSIALKAEKRSRTARRQRP